MNADKFRGLLRAQPFRRFLVKTTDGDTFEVEHPDYALVSPAEGTVVIFDRDDHFRIVSMDHVVTLEPSRNGAKKVWKKIVNLLWNELATRATLTFSDAQHALFNSYLDLLFAANERMNLTRITDRPAAEVQHIGDALTLLPFLPLGAFRLADIGSGGGVPGIPLAIARPDATVLLIESTKKKAVFLRETAAALNLSNVTVSELRAEEVGHSPERETFEIVTARAVATLDWLAEWCLPLVKKHGKMLAMKGERANEEVPAAKRTIQFLGGGEAVVRPIELPGSEHRVVVEIRKVAKTSDKFPRPATQAKGKPLGASQTK